MIPSLATFAVLSLSVAPLALAQTCTPCEDVHFFLARGNNEPYPGRQAALVEQFCDGTANCGYEDLIYSALYTDLSCQTTYDGVLAGFTQMTAYASRCPDSKLILAGYSQGAQIVTDILGGGGGESFNGCIQPDTPPLDRSTSPGNRLNAVIAFGNTRHTGNQPYNFGNGSAINGIFPRPDNQLSALTAYTDITRDWCFENDPICAFNQTDSLVSVHLGYYNTTTGEAVAWLKSVVAPVADPAFVTTIPLSISGTAQDYATVPSGTPSGSVILAATTTAPVDCGTTAALEGAALSTTNGSVTSTRASTGNPRSTGTVMSTTAPALGSAGAPLASAASASVASATAASASAASATVSADSSNSASTYSHVSNMGFGLLLAGLVAIAM